MKRLFLLVALCCATLLGLGQTFESQLRFENGDMIELEATRVLSYNQETALFVDNIPSRTSTQITTYISDLKGQEGWAITTVGKNTKIIGATSRGNFESFYDRVSQSYKIHYPDETYERPVQFCDALEIPEPELPQPRRNEQPELGQLNEICVQLDLHADYSHVSDYASVDEAIEEILATYSVVSYLYSLEQINLVVSSLSVYPNQATDPFAGIQTSYDGLYAIGDYASAFGINGDLIQLISDNGSGGVAWINGLGNSNLNYRSSFASIHGNYFEYPTYSWDVEVITHELGHNLGSRHTHGCHWGENGDDRIDDCGNFAGYLEGANCWDEQNPILPTLEGGTIMSYCHLVGSVGINFVNGFGQEPGDVIRARVAQYGSLCNTNCLAPFDFEVVAVTATSVTFNWTALEGFTYELSVGGQIVNPATPPVTVTGLSPVTNYVATVISTCQDGENSYPATRTFETRCLEAEPLPYTASFNTGNNGWSSVSTGEMTLELVATVDFSDFYWETSPGLANYGVSSTGYINSPCISFVGANSPTLRVDVAWEMETAWDGAKIQYTTDNINWIGLGDLTSWVINGYNNDEVYSLGQSPGWSGNTTGTQSEGWVEAIHSLDFLVGQESVRFRVFIGSDIIIDQGFGFRFDNFRIATSSEPCTGEDQTVFTGSCDIAETDTTTQVLIDENGCTYTLTTIIEPLPSDYVVLPDAPTCAIEFDGVTVTYFSTNEYGCDSITEQTYYYAGQEDEFIELTTCFEDEAGVVEETFTNEEGCDYTVTTTTTWVGSPDQYFVNSTCLEDEAGVVTVTETNENGCEFLVTTETIYEGQEDVVINENTCNKDDEGVVSVVLTNEAGCDYTETTITTWVGQDDEFVTVFTCNPDEVGTVTETVTNEFGCDYLVTTTTELDNDCPGECTLTVDAGDCYTIFRGTNNWCETVTANVSGGTPPYTYSWSNPNFVGSTNNVCIRVTSTYTVTVTDVNGCTATDEFTVEVVDIRCANGNSHLLVCRDGQDFCLKRNEAISLVEAGGASWGSCDYVPCSPGNRVAGVDYPLLGITVYPNPTNGLVSYEFDALIYPNLEIDVQTIDGRRVGTWQTGLNKKDVIDLSGQENGVYLLHFYDAPSMYTLEYLGTVKVVLNK